MKKPTFLRVAVFQSQAPHTQSGAPALSQCSLQFHPVCSPFFPVYENALSLSSFLLKQLYHHLLKLPWMLSGRINCSFHFVPLVFCSPNELSTCDQFMAICLQGHFPLLAVGYLGVGALSQWAAKNFPEMFLIKWLNIPSVPLYLNPNSCDKSPFRSSTGLNISTRNQSLE